MQLSRGFSLIELLVVVTIIAVITAVSMPAYNTYLVKARITELLIVADAYKIKLAEDFLSSESSAVKEELDSNLIQYVAIGTIPGQSPKHVIQVVAKMQDSNGPGIGLVQPSSIDDPLIVQLHGSESGAVITWTCHVASVYNKYVPKNCQNNELENLNLA